VTLRREVGLVAAALSSIRFEGAGMASFYKTIPPASIHRLEPRQYLVRVTLVVSQLHRVTATSATEASQMAPHAEIVGDTELIDILDSVPIQLLR
jgi:hypothetical protein